MQDSMRRVLIDRLLSDKSVVTLQELQDVLKVSIPTIKRDLRYMRKELKAPIVYSRTRGGYLYDLPAGKSGASPEFQRFWFSAQELYVVVKMVDMLRHSRRTSLRSFFRISNRCARAWRACSISAARVRARFSAG